MSDTDSEDAGRKRKKSRRCGYADCGKTIGNLFPCVLCVHEGFPHPNYYCSKRCEILEFENRHKHQHEKAKKAPAGSDLQKDYFERVLWARSKDLRGPAKLNPSVEPNDHDQIPDVDSALEKKKEIVITKVHSSKDVNRNRVPDFTLLRCAYSKCESTELEFSCDMCSRRNTGRFYCTLRCKNLDFLDGHMYEHHADSSVSASFYERLQAAVSQSLDFDTDPEEPVLYNVVNSLAEAEEQGAVGGAKMVNIIIGEPDSSPRRCAFANCENREEFYGEFAGECQMCFLNLQPRVYCSPNCLNKDFLNGHWRAHAEAFDEPQPSSLRMDFFWTLNEALNALIGNSSNAVNTHETDQSSLDFSEYSAYAHAKKIDNRFSDILQCATNILSVLRFQIDHPFDRSIDLSGVALPELMGKMVKTFGADLLDVTDAEKRTNSFDNDGRTIVVLDTKKDVGLINFIEEWDRVAGALSEHIDRIVSEGTTHVGDEPIEPLHRCANDNCERVALFPCYACALRQETNPKFFCGPICESLEYQNGGGHQHKNLDYAELSNQIEEGESGAVGGENEGCPPISVDEKEAAEKRNTRVTNRTPRTQRHRGRRRCETCGAEESCDSPTRHKACPLCNQISKDGLPFQIHHRKR